MKSRYLRLIKKQRGFTLIELLAVILILGIIALIAIPTVSRTVNEARINANKRSLDGHVKAIEQGVMENILKGEYSNLDGFYSYNDLKITNDKTSDTVKCSIYEIRGSELVGAQNCLINDSNYCYSKDTGSDLCENINATDMLVNSRVKEIRTTPNTDVSSRTGNIYYVSSDGNDSNNGLSSSNPIKTMSKLQTMFTDGTIKAGDTILFRDGDTFRGNLDFAISDILIGSYGDISKGKPILNRSLYDGAKTGKWTEVQKNIWKYEVNGSKPFNQNVGVIWFFCNDGNKNCSQRMDNVDKSFEFSQLVTTDKTFDESNMDSKIASLLTRDLQHYHTGHVGSSTAGAGTLYLYSTSDPSTRFDSIEFALGANIIHLGKATNLKVDNIKFLFGGSHGIGTGTVANLSVTNSEFGFTGGAVQHYNNTYATRYGNAIEIYGSVQDSYGYTTTDGFVIDNCYAYQTYDAGLTFQITTANPTKILRASFTNNVVEYSNYNIEYWNYTESTDQSVINDSYIKYFGIKDNIFRYSGYGVCTTRPNGGVSAHIKTWSHPTGFNILNGEFIIENNVFDTSADMFVYLRTNADKDLPILRNNKFIDDKGTPFGYYATSSGDSSIAFIPSLLTDYFKTNVFISPVTVGLAKSDSGKSGDVNWDFNASTHTLTISGSGNMADYSLDNLPPYYKYKDNIYKIVIGENVTSLGKYAFYEFKLLTEIRIDAIRLSDLAIVDGDVNKGDNFTFYNAGKGWLGIKLIFGPEVTYIPKMLLRPNTNASAPNVTNVVFEGNKISTIGAYGLASLNLSTLKIPEGVKTLNGVALGYASKLKVLLLPDSLTTLSGWTFTSDSSLEKIVFGSGSVKFGDATFYNVGNLESLVIPNLSSTTVKTYSNTFKGHKRTINCYGNSIFEDYINSHIENTGETNVIYNNMNNYLINITSSDNSISDVKKYNDSFSFTSNKNVKVFEYYIDRSGTKHIIDELTPIRNGNNYTINNLRTDIYIELN